MRYLTWLSREVQQRGGTLRRQVVASLEELSTGADLIVNCSGLGARALTDDQELQPVRGQYLVLAARSGAGSEYVGDDENPDGMAYVIPRGRDVLVGGTEEYGVESLSFEIDPDALIQRCSQLCPWLADPTNVAITRRVVGLRPWRPSGVRLCLDGLQDGTPIVHNYGHGGSGFSLSWGCAVDVAALAARA